MNISIGYILISTTPDSEYEIYNSLKQHPLVSELNPLFREYDLIIKLNTRDNRKIANFVKNKIRSLDGVIDTKTLQ